MWKQSRSAIKNGKLDIHTKLMKNYKEVPQLWFHILLVACIGVSLMTSFIWKKDVQLPWWGMLLAFGFSWMVTLPIGVIIATTNQQTGTDIMAEYIIGYILPGKPIANLLFKIYGRISTVHAISFLSDLKLGHYMKIPPRCMFTAQVFSSCPILVLLPISVILNPSVANFLNFFYQLVGTVFAGIVNLSVAWWMLETVENICEDDSLHSGSQWTCPKYRVTFDASVIWGLVGPKRLFGSTGLYRNLVWLLPIGAILPVPVWLLSRKFPEKKWIRLIHIPVICFGFSGIPPATPTNIASWIITGTIFNYFVFKYRKGWWQKYNYVLSAALDAGTALMSVMLFFILQNNGKKMEWWGTELDHCPLASCPTEPGIVVQGCPVVE